MRILVTALLLLCFSIAHSANQIIAVNAGQYDVQFDIDGQNTATGIGKLEFELKEQLGTNLYPGLHIGYNSLSQSDNAITEGQNQTGQHLGLSLDALFPLYKDLSATLDTRHTFHASKASTENRETLIEWYEHTLGAGAAYRIGNWRIGGKINYLWLSGTEKTNGDVNQTRFIEGQDGLTSNVHADLLIDRGGVIRFIIESGEREGFFIQLQRQIKTRR